VVLHERLNNVVEQFAVEIEEEYAKQTCIYAKESADDPPDEGFFLFLLTKKHGGSFLPAVAVVKIKQ
jgi:hypothetical protein